MSKTYQSIINQIHAQNMSINNSMITKVTKNPPAVRRHANTETLIIRRRRVTPHAPYDYEST